MQFVKRGCAVWPKKLWLCFRASFLNRSEVLEQKVKFLTNTEDNEDWIEEQLDDMEYEWAADGYSQRRINRLRERERKKLQTEKDYESGNMTLYLHS